MNRSWLYIFAGVLFEAGKLILIAILLAGVLGLKLFGSSPEPKEAAR